MRASEAEIPLSPQLEKPKIDSKVYLRFIKSRTTIPAAIKRKVWERDHGKCQHLSETTGKRCGSSYLIEVDHIKRVRHGGDNEPKNLQLLCHAHNLLRG